MLLLDLLDMRIPRINRIYQNTRRYEELATHGSIKQLTCGLSNGHLEVLAGFANMPITK
jgi:hypothetical protein